MADRKPPGPTRRSLLTSLAVTMLAGTSTGALAKIFPGGSLPWTPYSALPPEQVLPGNWYFFTPEEARTIEAVADCIIPPDELSVGGREAGCAVYLDRQLAGPYGSSSKLYTKGPFLPGLPTQGYQGAETPAERYRVGLAALNDLTRKTKGGKAFADLPVADQVVVLKDLEASKVDLGKIKGKPFFELMLGNIMEGFFADPVYGGNKDMVSWKMIGFPGARYDYRDHMTKHNQPYPLPPVSIASQPLWAAK